MSHVLASAFVMLVMFGLGCGGKSGPETTTATTKATTSTTAECSPEECQAAPEPPIAPEACGEGHESEIGTVCKRQDSGTCAKVLHCAGADADATK